MILRPDIAEEHLELILASVPQDGTLMEWGSGGSTVWFAERLLPEQRLISIEHDRLWWDKVIGQVAGNTQVEVWLYPPKVDPGPYGHWLRENPAPHPEYIAGQSVLDTLVKADTVFVDGVARGACLLTAAMNMSLGSIFLHDAERDWYHWSIQAAMCSDIAIEHHGPKPGHHASLIRIRLEP